MVSYRIKFDSMKAELAKNRKVFKMNRLIYVCAALFIASSTMLAAGCSGGGDSAPLSVVDPTTTPCGPDQKMDGHKAMWVYYHCDYADSLEITPESVDPRTGAPLGDLTVGRGMLSLRYHYLSNSDFGTDLTFGIFFQAGGRAHDWEVNWQFISFWYVPKNMLFSKIVIQRFDTTCTPFCEKASESDKLQFTDTNDVYQWDCEWDADLNKDKLPSAQGLITCVVTKVGDPTFSATIKNNTMGPYNHLKYIGLGKKAMRNHNYGSYHGQVTDVKLTIFD